jgi:hypothetical protein
MAFHFPEKLDRRRPDDHVVHLLHHDIYELLRSTRDELNHQLATRRLCSLKSEASLEKTFADLKRKFPDRNVPRAFILKLADTQDSRLLKSRPIRGRSLSGSGTRLLPGSTGRTKRQSASLYVTCDEEKP